MWVQWGLAGSNTLRLSRLSRLLLHWPAQNALEIQQFSDSCVKTVHPNMRWLEISRNMWNLVLDRTMNHVDTYCHWQICTYIILYRYTHIAHTIHILHYITQIYTIWSHSKSSKEPRWTPRLSRLSDGILQLRCLQDLARRKQIKKKPKSPKRFTKLLNTNRFFLLSLSLLLFFLLIFLFSLPLPCSAFHLSILSEVWLLNFLRLSNHFYSILIYFN